MKVGSALRPSEALRSASAFVLMSLRSEFILRETVAGALSLSLRAANQPRPHEHPRALGRTRLTGFSAEIPVGGKWKTHAKYGKSMLPKKVRRLGQVKNGFSDF